MSPSLNPREWFKPKTDPELMDFGRSMAYAETTKSGPEIEFDKGLGVNRELLHDPFFESLLEELCYVWRPLTDKDGNPRINDGEIQYYKAGVNWHGVAMRGLFSQLNRVSFITEKEAKIQKVYLELLIVKIRASQPETSYSLSQSAFFDWLLMIGRSIIDDNVKGRKAQLLKRITKATSVEVSQRANNKGESMV